MILIQHFACIILNVSVETNNSSPVSFYLHAGVGAGEALGVELALVEELEATLPGAVVAAALHRPPADPELLGALVRAVNEPSRNFTVSTDVKLGPSGYCETS